MDICWPSGVGIRFQFTDCPFAPCCVSAPKSSLSAAFHARAVRRTVSDLSVNLLPRYMVLPDLLVIAPHLNRLEILPMLSPSLSPKHLDTKYIFFLKNLVLFLSVLDLCCCVGSSPVVGFSWPWPLLFCCRVWARGLAGFGSCRSQAQEHRVNSCGAQA